MYTLKLHTNYSFKNELDNKDVVYYPIFHVKKYVMLRRLR